MNATDTRPARRPARPIPAPDPSGPSSAHIDLQRLEKLRRLAWWLDARWRLPLIKVPFGLDGVASLLPVVGDTATAVVSAYIVREAARYGLPKRLIARMVVNVLLDWALGSVPVIGTVFDIAFKANRANLALLHRHLEERLHGGPLPV